MTPLAHAAAEGRSAVVRHLLAGRRIDPGILDNNGPTALGHAKKWYCSLTVKLIQQRMGLQDR